MLGRSVPERTATAIPQAAKILGASRHDVAFGFQRSHHLSSEDDYVCCLPRAKASFGLDTTDRREGHLASLRRS